MVNVEWKKQKHHILTGKTIELVPVTKEDMDFICIEETDKQLWKYEEYVETDKEYVIQKFTDRIEQDNVFDFIVKRISDGEPIGVVYIWKYGLNRKSWEIGYVILPKYQGKGYCLDSVNQLLSFAFEELDAHKVVGMCHCDNLKSASIMQKAGMLKQGVFREEYLCQGKWVDQLYFSILERDYNNKS